MSISEIKSKKEVAVGLLRDLVRFPTVVPPGDNYREIIEFVAPRFEDMGFQVRMITVPEKVLHRRQNMDGLQGERVNMQAWLDVGAEETLVVNTHLDVVPVTDEWTRPPFEGIIEDGRMYGRGTADSKAEVASLITYLSTVDPEDLKYNLNVVLTTDEERGPYSGLAYLADEEYLSGDYFFSMDGSGDFITIGSLGDVKWQLEVFGKSVHSGSSFLGVNAIEKSMPYMEEILNLKEIVGLKRSSLPSNPRLRETTGLENVRPVLNINIIHAGIKENVVPGRLVMQGDRRLIPEEDRDEAVAELEEAIIRGSMRATGTTHQFTWAETYPAYSISSDHPWVGRIKTVADVALGRDVPVAGAQGSLDVAYAVNVTGLPAAGYGIGRTMESNIHGDDENIRIEDLVEYMKFLHHLLTVR